MSGGGSNGLSHIGVLKALEENGVPINYICGTSIGGLVSGYYAIGYSPKEIEDVVKTFFFQKITKGFLPIKYDYLFKKHSDFASWLSIKYNFNDTYFDYLPTSIINSNPIDYYLMETFSGVAVKKNNNFDSLFIPFRCIASDIEDKKTIVFKNGNLASSIRASITYPFYLKPISIDNKLLFDGGLYNNFPIDIMLQEFKPDIIIGSNVSEKNQKPTDDNLYLQLRSLLTKKTDVSSYNNLIIIEPSVEEKTFSFEDASKLIDSGYKATIRKMPEIKEQIKSQINFENIEARRKTFNNYRKNLNFNEIEVIGLNKYQSRYITNSLFKKQKSISITEFQKNYFRLSKDDKIKNLYPIVKLDSLGKNYTLKLFCKKEKTFYIEPGAIVSNRPISEAFLGLQYNLLRNFGFSAYINGYIGKLNTGAHTHLRFDIPSRLPIFIEPSITFSSWDYFNSSALFYDLIVPAYLIQEDKFTELKIGVPVGNNAQFNISSGYTEWKNKYYQSDFFKKTDTADVTYFDYKFLQANYQFNTLNKKMYATEGLLLNIRARYLAGYENYIPGNTSVEKNSLINKQQAPWLQLKFSFDSYIKTFKGFKIGIFTEAVYSNQNFFNNYKSTILSAPAFNPTPESQTFFIKEYRAHSYLASGIKAISSPFNNINLRIEAYIFQPYQSILNTKEGTAKYSEPLLYRYFSGVTSLVYNSPIGPISIGLNYYDANPNPFSFFFHIGYIIFNRKSIE